MELEFDKYCKLSGSPNTVLPSPRCRSKVGKRRSVKGNPTLTNNLFTLGEDFTGINFHHYRSTSCKNIPSRTSGLERNEVLKRGSVYQSSRERMKMKNSEVVESRRKIELSGSNAISFSFGIVDSLCSSDEDSSITEMKRSSVMSKISESSTNLDLSVDHCKEKFVSLEKNKLANAQFKCDKPVSPVNDEIGFRELQKSLSAKLAMPHSPSHSESDSSRPSSPKARFFPIRRMFDPFTKSKSQRSPLGSVNTLRKSLLNDFSKTPRNPKFGSRFSKEHLNNLDVSSSPAHLHGCLRLESKHGLPIFEFSLNFPEDVLVARRWKVDNGLSWLYTFHSFPNRRKSNATQWELKDLKKGSSMVGQMRVSCYLHMEPKGVRVLDNSLVSEFLLYDVVKPLKDLYSFTPSSMELKDLNPNSETAAIVVQLPFEKRESLKYNGGNGGSNHPHRISVDLCGTEERKERILSPVKVNVVIPSGSHSLPSDDAGSNGPSSLLDRWRLGGGCDCGGWDMACPLTVFGNSNIQSAVECLIMENQQPLELFVQGAKENSPALTMTTIDEGRYSVDFHAKLSTLQAFSICVAILHCTEASVAVTRESDEQLWKSDSLRVCVEDDKTNLIDEVDEEEKGEVIKKMGVRETIPFKVTKKMGVRETVPSFKINPPFSPMSRV